MKVEILTIGDEILSGDILDTNKQFLSTQLWENGFEIICHTSIRDDEHAITQAILEAQKRVDIVICTGGLGPTRDDFTIEIAAKTFGVGCEFDQQTVKLLQDWYHKQGRELAENNKKQALIPQGGQALHNRFGTAPGVYYCFKGVHFYFLPGVPKEMKAIFAESVFPAVLQIRQQAGEKIFFATKRLHTFGIPESQLDRELAPLFDSRVGIGNVRIGYRVRFPDILVKLSAWAESAQEANQSLEKVLSQVRQKAQKYIYSEDEKNLETVFVEALKKNHKTFAAAESCTGGLLSHRVTNVVGSSSVFLGSFITYSNQLKTSLLGVSPDILQSTTKGAVSSECAEAMVLGLYQKTGADFCVAITGIAGPDGGSEDKPVGTVYVAFAVGGVIVENTKYFFPFPRDMFKQIVTSTVLKKILNLL